MRSKIVALASLMLLGQLAAVSAFGEGAGKLTVRFRGIEEEKGEVLLSVANSREMFESDSTAIYSASPPAKVPEVTVVFEAIPAGEYAIKVFQDADSNRKLDIGWRGPKEKYGFSNNVMGFMGPPDFDDAKFDFDGTELVVEIDAR